MAAEGKIACPKVTNGQGCCMLYAAGGGRLVRQKGGRKWALPVRCGATNSERGEGKGQAGRPPVRPGVNAGTKVVGRRDQVGMKAQRAQTNA